MASTKKPGYRAENVRLISLTFKLRESDGELDASTEMAESQWSYRITSEVSRANRTIRVTAGLSTGAPEGKVTALDATVLMRARFTWEEPVSLSVEEFARTNAPAFLWPYLRELVWNLALRAGQPPVLLPVINLKKAEVQVVDGDGSEKDANGSDSCTK